MVETCVSKIILNVLYYYIEKNVREMTGLVKVGQTGLDKFIKLLNGLRQLALGS